MTETMAPRLPIRRRRGLLRLLKRPGPAATSKVEHGGVATLSEAAATVSVEGRVVEANEAWRALMGHASRMPGGSSLYTAMAAARRGDLGEAQLKVAGTGRTASIAVLDART